MKELSKNIKQLRMDCGMTQEELAGRLNVTRQAVSNWENGKSEPDINMIHEIARVCNGNVAVLLGVDIADSRKYPLHQSKYVISVIVCAAIIIIGIIARAVIEPYLKSIAHKEFIITPYILCYMIYNTIFFSALGWMAMAIIALSQDIRISLFKRRIVLIMVLLLLVTLTGIAVNIFEPFCNLTFIIRAISNGYIWSGIWKGFPFMAGLGSFLYWNR